MGSSSWWGPYTPARSRADVGGRPGSLGRADQPWGPSIARALDVQACAATGRGTATARAHGGAATGRRPAGTSQWHQIEYRMCSHISMHWRGQPLTSHEVSVHVMATTTTEKGLKSQAERDSGCDPTGIKVTDEAQRRRTSTSGMSRRVARYAHAENNTKLRELCTDGS